MIICDYTIPNYLIDLKCFLRAYAFSLTVFYILTIYSNL